MTRVRLFVHQSILSLFSVILSLLVNTLGSTEREISAASNWLRDKGAEFNPKDRNEFYSPHNCVQANSESLPIYYQIYTGINRPELEADPSPAPNAEHML